MIVLRFKVLILSTPSGAEIPMQIGIRPITFGDLIMSSAAAGKTKLRAALILLSVVLGAMAYFVPVRRCPDCMFEPITGEWEGHPRQPKANCRACGGDGRQTTLEVLTWGWR